MGKKTLQLFGMLRGVQVMPRGSCGQGRVVEKGRNNLQQERSRGEDGYQERGGDGEKQKCVDQHEDEGYGLNRELHGLWGGHERRTIPKHEGQDYESEIERGAACHRLPFAEKMEPAGVLEARKDLRNDEGQQEGA